MKFRVRLALIFITLIALSVFASGLFMAKTLKDSHMDSLRSGMQREAQAIAVLTAMDGDSWNRDAQSGDYFDALAKRLEQPAGARVTFIGYGGKVLGDSEREPERMDNHLRRSEIVQAAQHGTGYSVRHSDTAGRMTMYVAVAIVEGGQTNGFVRLSRSLDEVEATIGGLWKGIILATLALFALAGLLSYRVAHRLTRPLEHITGLAKQITLMNYNTRVDIGAKDEIGQLGQVMNRMADSLELQMNRVQEDENRLKSVLDTMISGVVLIDKEDRIMLLNRQAEDILGFAAKELLGKKYKEAKLQQELRDMIEECVGKKQHIRDEIVLYFPQERVLEVNMVPMRQLEKDQAGIVIVLHDMTAVRRLERMRSEFVANVSHELKTPVAAVQGFAETLLAGALNDSETAKSFLRIIYDESTRLNRLIGDILDLSKIESKRVRLQFTPVHLQSFAQTTADMLKSEADKKRIELEVEINEDLYIEADEDRLRQILLNLLDNGVHYTPEGGKVRIKAFPMAGSGNSGDHVEEKVVITVKDTGIGIPKKDLPRIFERFYRVDKARSRGSGGTGLGLSIVKHLVELHHGTIRVESRVGTGTSFIIELPIIQ
jgi:two-component system phosphate regulon sensor histidine kinase PhoR